MKKDWKGNRNSIFKTLGASSHTEKERQTEDFYATDPKAAELLLKLETFSLFLFSSIIYNFYKIYLVYYVMR